jgi:hypothetical protein
MDENLIKECQSSKKQLILFSDGQHNTTWLSNNYTNQIRHFLTEVNNRIYFFIYFLK